jgi:hypothetical protein
MKKLFFFYLLCVMPIPLVIGILALFRLYPVNINHKLYYGFYPFIVMITFSLVLAFAMAAVHWLYLKLRKKH